LKAEKTRHSVNVIESFQSPFPLTLGMWCYVFDAPSGLLHRNTLNQKYRASPAFAFKCVVLTYISGDNKTHKL